jgi:glycosyltransferase involved in cell wall biosynthesis
MISFVIPAFNEENTIGLCIVAIHEEAIKHGEYEIIVVDNCSTDNTAKLARLFKKWGVRLISESHKGVTRARQAGYKAATGDIICNIDADTFVPQHWLHYALKALDGAVMATGPVEYLGFSPSLRFLARVFYSIGKFAHYAIGPISMGGNTILRTYALDMIGGYNPSIDFWGEDTDTAKRMAKVGKVRYSRDMWVWASSRRFDKEGVVTTTTKYIINYLTVTLLGRPIHKVYKDIRS